MHIFDKFSFLQVLTHGSDKAPGFFETMFRIIRNEGWSNSVQCCVLFYNLRLQVIITILLMELIVLQDDS